MELSALPTDNLYKFCAILGLTFLILNTYYNFEMKYKSRIDYEILSGDLDRNKYEWELLNGSVDKLTITIKKSNATMEENLHAVDSLLFLSKLQVSSKKTSLLQEKALPYLDENINLGKIIDSLKNKLEIQKKEVKLKKIDLDVKSKINNIENAKTQKYAFFLWGGTIIGLILSFYGFCNWFKNQKILDQKLRSNP